MKREELIKRIKSWHLSHDDMAALAEVIPELRESEEEKALRIIKKRMCYDPAPISDEDRRIVEHWLEKQKEQKPADDKAFEEWIDDWWKHNKVNNPYSYDKGDEIQFDERGFKNFCHGIRNMYQQKPAEWSEEDENIRKLLIWQVHRNIEDETNDLAQSVYDGIKGHDPDLEESIEDWKKCLAWLKSLRPSWKPSEEQMGALQAVINDPNNAGSLTCQLGLQDLLNCLEKL